MDYTILNGDALDMLRTLPDESVQCCVTSPPYYSLRDYQVPGQIGLEPTPDAYVARLVEVFREVRRVLRDSGVLWCNLGDSYGAGKQLLGIPWRVAFALQADGWYLRADVIWHKPNPMPESVTDRPTKAHEYVFLLTKSARYFYDAQAVSEPSTQHSQGRMGNHAGQKMPPDTTNGRNGSTLKQPDRQDRNRRSVWTISTRPYSGAHFATMPPDLARVCVLAGTSERGCCPTCGAPWERVVERETVRQIAERNGRPPTILPKYAALGRYSGGTEGVSVAGNQQKSPNITTLGWRASCDCPEHEPIPCTVLDPFAGSGTTLAVAVEAGRNGIGIELNPEYIELAHRRIAPAQAKRAAMLPLEDITT